MLKVKNKNKNKNKLSSFFLVFFLLVPAVSYAETIDSENYSIDSGRISTGEISLPYAESGSYSMQASNTETTVVDSDDDDDGDSDDDDDDSSSKKKKKSSSTVSSLINRFFGGNEEEKTDEENTLPKKLFDINLEIDDAIISDIKKLSTRVIFTSFGTEPTPVDLTFMILDESNREVYRDEGEDVDITVETEAVFNKNFQDAPELLKGKYTLVLSTLYNFDVRDEFRQEFTIGESSVKRVVLPIAIIAGLVLAFLMIRSYRNRKQKNA